MSGVPPAREQIVPSCEAAVAVALSVLLGTLRVVELPSGGSITLAALPLLVLGISRGVRVGVLAGCCAGLAHALSGGTIIHPAQLLLDYVAGYGALGLSGWARGRGLRRRELMPAVLAATSVQYACSVISGVVFFAPVAGAAALWYSTAYNAATAVPELLLAAWLTAPLLRALARANPADAWRRGLLDPPLASPRVPRTYRPALRVQVLRAPDPTAPAVISVPAPASFVRRAPFSPRRAAQ